MFGYDLYREIRNVVAILNKKAATDRNVIAAENGNNISDPVLKGRF